MGANKLAQYLVDMRRDVYSLDKETAVEKLPVGFSQDRLKCTCHWSLEQSYLSGIGAVFFLSGEEKKYTKYNVLGIKGLNRGAVWTLPEKQVCVTRFGSRHGYLTLHWFYLVKWLKINPVYCKRPLHDYPKGLIANKVTMWHDTWTILTRIFLFLLNQEKWNCSKLVFLLSVTGKDSWEW